MCLLLRTYSYYFSSFYNAVYQLVCGVQIIRGQRRTSVCHQHINDRTVFPYNAAKQEHIYIYKLESNGSNEILVSCPSTLTVGRCCFQASVVKIRSNLWLLMRLLITKVYLKMCLIMLLWVRHLSVKCLRKSESCQRET